MLNVLITSRNKTITLERMKRSILNEVRSGDQEGRCLAQYKREMELLQQEKMSHVEELRQIHADINAVWCYIKSWCNIYWQFFTNGIFSNQLRLKYVCRFFLKMMSNNWWSMITNSEMFHWYQYTIAYGNHIGMPVSRNHNLQVGCELLIHQQDGATVCLLRRALLLAHNCNILNCLFSLSVGDS